MENNLDENSNCSPLKLWEEYRKILLSDKRKYEKSQVQDELIDLGLVVVQDNFFLQVKNLIFSQVFNQDFVAKKTFDPQFRVKNILKKKQ